MSLEIPTWLYSIPILGAPIGYLYTLAISHRGKISKIQTEITELQKTNEKVTKLCNDVSYIKGEIDTFLKKSR